MSCSGKPRDNETVTLYHKRRSFSYSVRSQDQLGYEGKTRDFSLQWTNEKHVKERTPRKVDILPFTGSVELAAVFIVKVDASQGLFDEPCNTTSGAYAGGCTGCTCTPHLKKKIRSEASKRGKKVPPGYVGKNARSAQIQQN